MQLKNFKRFTDLVITGIPPESKLVLLIGANGSGKSSVFDAFEFLSRPSKKNKRANEPEYYAKNTNTDFDIIVNLVSGESLNSSNRRPLMNNESAKKFYGRSSLRIEPAIANNPKLTQIKSNADAPEKYTGFDRRFQQDVYQYMQDINAAVLGPVYRGEQPDTVKVFEEFIKPLNDSLKRIFGEADTNGIQLIRFQEADFGPPVKPAKMIFRKGNAEVNYDLLSHGEKQVVILVLDFIVRRPYNQDTLFFIDEMDVHLNTALQYNLLKEIVTEYIPDNCQLWTATHALGFIEYATNAGNAVIIDFDNYNFDTSVNLEPARKNDFDVFEIAVPRDTLANLITGKRIVLCENKNDEFYNSLSLKDTLFAGVLNSNAVFLYIKRDSHYEGIRDRDFLSDGEIAKLKNKFKHYHILSYYSFENYLFHPDNLEELSFIGFDKQTYTEDIIAQKKAKQIAIITDLKKSRDSYEEFKTDIEKDKEITSITDDLLSDEFERFYKYFNMRDKFDKTAYQKILSDKRVLASTNWFKTQIANILK